jgi:hypothetical protein
MTADMATYYDRVFLERSVLRNNFYKNAQKKPLPLNEGKTVNFTRFLPLATRTTALTETTTGGIAAGSGSTLKSMTVSATAAPYGNFTEVTELLRLTSIDKNMKEKVEVLAQQAGETIDELMMREYGDNCNRIRADADSSYWMEVATTSAGSTTTLISTTLTEADDYWNGGYVCITDRTNAAYGEVRAISDFTAATDTVTVDAAFSTAPGSGCTFRICEGAGLSNSNSADKLTHTNLSYAKRELDDKNALAFENGMYKGLVDPYSQFDFFASDSTFQGLAQQSRPTALEAGEIARWMGIQLFQQNLVWRSAVNSDSTYSATGAVRVLPIFGRESLGAVELEAQQNKVYVRGWKELGQPIPQYATIGWEIIFAQKMLNGCFGVGLMVTPSG